MKKLIICLAILSAVYAFYALLHLGTGVYSERLFACGNWRVDSLYSQKYFDGECWQEQQLAKTSRGDIALSSRQDFGVVGQDIQTGKIYRSFDVGKKFHGCPLYLLSSTFEIDNSYLRDNSDDMQAFIGIVLFCAFWFMAAKWDRWF